MNMDHLNYLEEVVKEDLSEIRRKETTYQGSWKKRGGLGAYMMVARKVDRLEEIVSRCGYDIFTALRADPTGQDGSALAELRDLRRYLILIESELWSENNVNERFVEAIVGSSRMPDPTVARLDDGLLLNDIEMDSRVYYMVAPNGGRGYHIVDRRKAPTSMWEHLARLSMELNNKEYEESLPEYKGLYRWDENGSKWVMREPYRELWGKL